MIMTQEMNVIVRLESGTDTVQPRGLTGEAAHKVALQMFGSKK